MNPRRPKNLSGTLLLPNHPQLALDILPSYHPGNLFIVNHTLFHRSIQISAWELVRAGFGRKEVLFSPSYLYLFSPSCLYLFSLSYLYLSYLIYIKPYYISIDIKNYPYLSHTYFPYSTTLTYHINPLLIPIQSSSIFETPQRHPIPPSHFSKS